MGPHVSTVLLNHPGEVVVRVRVVLLRGPVCPPTEQKVRHGRATIRGQPPTTMHDVATTTAKSTATHMRMRVREGSREKRGQLMQVQHERSRELVRKEDRATTRVERIPHHTEAMERVGIEVVARTV